MWEIIGLIGGLKNALAGIAGLAAAAWIWWLNRTRKSWKDESLSWRRSASIRKEDKATDEETEQKHEEVNNLPDSPDALQSMADKLRRTAETHKYKIMDELGLKTGAELVQYAIRHGLVTG